MPKKRSRSCPGVFTGFIRLLMEIPIWFDEGAALTLDYRAPFLPININLAETETQNVKDLVSAKAFFSGDTRSLQPSANAIAE